MAMVFNDTFNNISVILRRPVLYNIGGVNWSTWRKPQTFCPIQIPPILFDAFTRNNERLKSFLTNQFIRVCLSRSVVLVKHFPVLKVYTLI